MKHVAAMTLSAVAVVSVFAGWIAIIAGKDDIRRFHRMRSM